MGRRPIIIPRHKSHFHSHQRKQTSQDKRGDAKLALSGADSLAHPLAMMKISIEKQPGVGSDSGNSNSSSSSNIGIRRHGQRQQPMLQRQRNGGLFATPEKSKDLRVVRKRSPTTIILPLDFIKEEGEEETEEEEPDDRENDISSSAVSVSSRLPDSGADNNERNPSSVLSGGAMSSIFSTKPEDVDNDDFLKYNRENADGNEEDRLSEIFDTSVFGSVIERVDESIDFDNGVVLPKNEGVLQGMRLFSDSDIDDNHDDEQSTGTFREMMLQQDEQFASTLTTSFGSSIATTSTLERSLEERRKPYDGNLRFVDVPFRRILESVGNTTRDGRMTEHGMGSCFANGKAEHNSCKTPTNSIESKNSPALSESPLILPEEQRRAVLARYRYNQIMHTKSLPKKNGENHRSSSRSSDDNASGDPCQLIYEDLERMAREAEEHRPEGNRIVANNAGISPEDSFAAIDDELRSLRHRTIRSNESFRLAAVCLSRDLHESDTAVRSLEVELEVARKQREVCLDRYESAKTKRQKERELTAVRTLHLEILARCGANRRARKMLLEHHNETADKGRTMAGPYGARFLQRKRGPTERQRTAAGKESSRGRKPTDNDVNDDDAAGVPNASPGFVIFAGSRREGNAGDHRHSPDTHRRAETASNEDGSETPDRDPYGDKTVEDLRLIKNRLEAIKDAFEKARYMVSESGTSADALRKRHQSQLVIENAASKYILLGSKNLI